MVKYGLSKFNQLSRTIRKPSGSAFSPLNLGNVQTWFDATKITGLADGASVSQWDDASGLNYHASQATAAKKPTYKTGILNSKPVVRFDGVDDFLQTAAFSAPIAQPTTIFIVFSSINAPDGTYLTGLSLGGRHQLFYSPGGSSVALYAGAQISYVKAAPFAHFIGTWVVNGASSAFYDNGVSKVTGNAGTNSLDGITLGGLFDGTTLINCDIAELIVYRTGLSTADRQSVESYLSAKWGIAI